MRQSFLTSGRIRRHKKTTDLSIYYTASRVASDPWISTVWAEIFSPKYPFDTQGQVVGPTRWAQLQRTQCRGDLRPRIWGKWTPGDQSKSMFVALGLQLPQRRHPGPQQVMMSKATLLHQIRAPFAQTDPGLSSGWKELDSVWKPESWNKYFKPGKRTEAIRSLLASQNPHKSG